jgi:hypothetical protein
MGEPRQDPRVDELRRQLRSLGYLDAGVDRFVLGPARETRRPLTIAGLTGVRIGAIAGLLLGPAAAIGVAAQVRGLITGPRDGFVVALYLAVLFAAAVSIVAFAANVIVAAIARGGDHGSRARTVALAAGIVVGAVLLVYLTLWWDASALSTAGPGRIFGPGRWSLLWTVCALGLAAGISVLVGHLVTVAALAVTVAHGGARGTRPGVPGTSRRVLSAAGALAFVGALLLFTLTARSAGTPAEPPRLAVVPSGLRITMFAIDGFDPGVAERLATAGRIPALRSALGLDTADPDPSRPLVGRQGAGGSATARAVVHMGDTRDPARTWTTVATGQPADVHAVRGLQTRRVLGVQGTIAGGEPSPLARAIAAVTDLLRLTEPSIASGEERQARTFWEVATQAGLRTATVNWWATWPARTDGGTLVTDRAALRLERGGALDAEIAPAETYGALHAAWPAVRARAAALASALQTTGTTDDLLRRSAELDALQRAIADRLSGDDVDLVCTYLPGLDLVQHALLVAPEGPTSSPSAVGLRLAALEAYYVFLDRLLADALTPHDDELVIVLTSPGRVEGKTPGLLTLRGVSVNGRARDARATAIDVLPTVLHALGLPMSRELPGRPLVELFAPDFARRHPVRAVDTYGSPARSTAPRSGQPLDQEMIDRLRSLGYVR